MVKVEVLVAGQEMHSQRTRRICSTGSRLGFRPHSSKRLYLPDWRKETIERIQNANERRAELSFDAQQM
jgi:hypothetical protein